MLSRDIINARMNELEVKRKALEKALRGQPALDPKARYVLMEEDLSLGRVQGYLVKECLRWAEPRESVARSRVSEFVPVDLIDLVVLECTKVPRAGPTKKLTIIRSGQSLPRVRASTFKLVAASRRTKGRCSCRKNSNQSRCRQRMIN